MIMALPNRLNSQLYLQKEGDFMNPLYVGIDVSNKSNVIYLMFPNDDKHSNISIVNPHNESLVEKIFSFCFDFSLP